MEVTADSGQSTRSREKKKTTATFCTSIRTIKYTDVSECAQMCAVVHKLD